VYLKLDFVGAESAFRIVAGVATGMAEQAKMQSESSSVSASVCAAPSPGKFQEERRELEQVLSAPEISRSGSLVRFLSFICNKYFDGQADDIREYSIAVEALGRKDSSFDSHVDPIVRVTARALRKKLQEYYATDGREHELQIVLPLGHYVPQFVRREQAAAQAEPEALNSEPASAAATETTKSPSPLLAFVQKHRAAIAAAVFVVLLVPAVFFAGYHLGKTRTPQPRVVSDELKWGDPVWSDDFDGAAQQLPDPAKWTYDVGNPPGGEKPEAQIYCAPKGGPRDCDPHRPNAFQDGAGHLVLRAQRNPDGVWTSARITTRGLKEFQYGRIEARMRLPVGTGLWPAFWMLGASFDKVGWPAAGSVSIVENVSSDARSNGLGPSLVRSTLHGPRYSGANGLWHDFRLPNGARVDDGSFHTYGVIWSPGMIQFYVDDPSNVFFVQDSSDLPEDGEWVFDHPFDLVLNLAMGGDWASDPDATTPNPADILVDYVRVYKIPPVSAPSIQWQPVDVKAGSSVASIIKLQAPTYLGRVHLSCTTEPAIVQCDLGRSVVNFSDALTQEDSLTISTDSFTGTGRVSAPPGRYKVIITATSISGNHSQLNAPFEVQRPE
jgi:beta-glucanase (GH16 family)